MVSRIDVEKINRLYECPPKGNSEGTGITVPPVRQGPPRTQSPSQAHHVTPPPSSSSSSNRDRDGIHTNHHTQHPPQPHGHNHHHNHRHSLWSEIKHKVQDLFSGR